MSVRNSVARFMKLSKGRIGTAVSHPSLEPSRAIFGSTLNRLELLGVRLARGNGLLAEKSVAPEARTRDIDWLRADYARMNSDPFRHFFCPMLMNDEPSELILGHVVNEKFKDVPDFTIIQRKDIDGWYGSMFEADFLTLVRFQEKNVNDMFFGNKPPRGLKPTIKAGDEEVGYYHLNADPDDKPIDEHTLMEMNNKNGDFLRLALKKSPKEVMALQHV